MDANVTSSLNSKELELIETLKGLITNACKNFGSEKCHRYFIKDVGDDKEESRDFKTSVEEVATTIVGLMSTFGSTVTVEGEFYSVKEYAFPSRLEDLLNCGRIYASKDGIAKADPYYKVGHVNPPMTPSEFNRFFLMFNSFQGDLKKFTLTSGYSRKDVSLDEVQFIDDGTHLCKLRDEGMPMEICQLISVRIPSLESFLNTYSKVSERRMAEWLLG